MVEKIKMDVGWLLLVSIYWYTVKDKKPFDWKKFYWLKKFFFNVNKPISLG